MNRYGPDALAYGNSWGPPPLRQWICQRLEATDGRAPTSAEVLITGGTSQGLDMAATLLVQPGDVVLASEPTYHLALRILGEDHRFALRGVASDEHGVDVDACRRIVGQLARPAGRRAFLYTIPTFNNPTGGCLPDERRAALAALAAEKGIVILEDDTYRELAYDGRAPDSLWALGAPGTVVRFGSFAKSVAPGLRVGYLTADAPTVERIALSGFLDSGGSPGQLNAFVVAEYAAAGDYVRGVDRFREAYRSRRDALQSGLEAHFLGMSLGSSGLTWTRPNGGYFIWVTLPNDIDVVRLADAAARVGTGFMPASVYYVDKGRVPNAIRLSFARYPPAMLQEAAARLARAVEQSRS
jgi:DNA-binding transcriptional MocR family regulator